MNFTTEQNLLLITLYFSKITSFFVLRFDVKEEYRKAKGYVVKIERCRLVAMRSMKSIWRYIKSSIQFN